MPALFGGDKNILHLIVLTVAQLNTLKTTELCFKWVTSVVPRTPSAVYRGLDLEVQQGPPQKQVAGQHPRHRSTLIAISNHVTTEPLFMKGSAPAMAQKPARPAPVPRSPPPAGEVGRHRYDSAV